MGIVPDGQGLGWRGFQGMPESDGVVLWRGFRCCERGLAGPVRRAGKGGQSARGICPASDSYIWRYLSMLRADGSSFLMVPKQGTSIRPGLEWAGHSRHGPQPRKFDYTTSM